MKLVNGLHRAGEGWPGRQYSIYLMWRQENICTYLSSSKSIFKSIILKCAVEQRIVAICRLLLLCECVWLRERQSEREKSWLVCRATFIFVFRRGCKRAGMGLSQGFGNKTLLLPVIYYHCTWVEVFLFIYANVSYALYSLSLWRSLIFPPLAILACADFHSFLVLNTTIFIVRSVSKVFPGCSQFALNNV